MTKDVDVCVNIWLFMDPPSGVVQTAAVKAYATVEDEDQTYELLRRLSRVDFFTVPRVPVPQRFAIITQHGEQIAGAFMAGTPAEADVIAEVVETLVPLPSQVIVPGGEPKLATFPMPQDPLGVVTYVEERHDGTLVPRLAPPEGVA